MPLQFDTAVPAGTPPAACVACRQPVGETYFTAGKSVVCAPCKTRIENARPTSPGPLLLLRAVVCGLAGAAAGAVLYYAILRAGFQIAFVAIAVGFFVGRAMQFGTGGARGLSLQIIGVVLTYVGIAAGYATWGSSLLRGGAIDRLVTTLELPVLLVLDDLPGSPLTALLTAVIIGVGLRQAWTMNRPLRRPAFEGPFRMAAPTA